MDKCLKKWFGVSCVVVVFGVPKPKLSEDQVFADTWEAPSYMIVEITMNTTRFDLELWKYKTCSFVDEHQAYRPKWLGLMASLQVVVV
jgi:hypothetical protein